MCKHVVTTETFRYFSTQREYYIKPDNLNCRSRFNNFKSAQRNFIKGNTVKQALFHTNFEDDKHHGMSDLEIILIDQTESADNLRRRESFWQYDFDTFQPNGLNERDVALFRLNL